MLTLPNLYSQNLTADVLYPDTLFSTNDSFYIDNKVFLRVWPNKIEKSDTLGTNGMKGNSLKIWTDLDTITVTHVNFPYQQLVTIPMVGLHDTILLTLRFQKNRTAYTNQYVKSHLNNVKISIPETFELANIILRLSECSAKTGNRPDTEYSNRVDKYFREFKNHKLIQILNKKCEGDEYWDTYYGFRENSMCYEFDEEHFLQYTTPYKHVNNDKADIFGGHFRNLLYLVQDFATKSNFSTFYTQNEKYYNQNIERQKELLPIRDMWDWLENHFPQRKESFHIIFSPLIGGSHSTRNFATGYRSTEFEECLMFINSPENLDKTELEEKVKIGLMSGIVFTEIDHNYVNPVSSKHIDDIKNLLVDKDFWARKEAQKNYKHEYAIFNEYMTHSVFCLYIAERYKSPFKEEIINRRIALMERRGYPKFEEFNSRLIHLMQKTNKTLADSYKDIILEMNHIKM